MKDPKNPQTQEFQYRSGAPPFADQGWRGMNTESDPGSLAPNELQLGINVRLKGAGIMTRGAFVEKVDLSAQVGSQSVLYLAQAPVDNPRVRLWFVAPGCFGAAIGTGSRIQHYDEYENPKLQVYFSSFAQADRNVPLGIYGDKLIAGEGPMLYEVPQISAPSGAAASAYIANAIRDPIGFFDGFTVRCIQEFDAKLFIGLENNSAPASSKIVSWNGLSLTDDLTGIRPPLAFGIWRNKLVCGFDATAGNIRVRDTGSPPGTWTTFALAGFLTSTYGNAMQEARQYLYIASGTDKLFRFDGANLTLAQTIAGCATDGKGLTALTLHRGLLYYGWNTPSAAYASRIGRHDPDSTATEFLDTYKDVTTDQANFKFLASLRSYRQQIFAGGQQMWLVATANEDVKGSLEVINNTGAPGAGFEIRQLLRYPAAA